MNRLYIFLVILILSSCVFEDDNTPKPSDVFVKYYGASGEHKLYDMIVNKSSNVVLLASQKTTVDGSTFDFFIVEADTLGNQINTASFDVGKIITSGSDSLFFTSDIPQSIKEIDNGYLIVGSFSQVVSGSSLNSNIFWAELNQNLEIVVSDTITSGAGFNLYGNDIIKSRDGNIIIVGSTERPEKNDFTRNPGKQYFLTKIYRSNIDSVMWRKSFGYPASDDEAIAVYELDNDNIALIGSTQQTGNGGASGNNVGIMVLNNLATSLVSDEIFGIEIDNQVTSDDYPNDVIEISGGFVIVGTSILAEDQKPFLLGVRKSGVLIFSSALESRWGINGTGRGVAKTDENDLIVTGAYPEFQIDILDPDYKKHGGLINSKNSEVLFLRTGQTGIVKGDYENNFGLAAGNDVGEVIVTLPNGSLAIGATIDFGSNQTMIALMKINDLGILQRQ